MFEHHATLRDGEKVLIRPLKAGGRDAISGFSREVTRGGSALAFFVPMREVGTS